MKSLQEQERHRNFWDGVQRAYIPIDPLQVPPSVSLHNEYDEEIDPITYEVVRHNLWNVNLEQGKIVENLAVSPITLETRDFQTAIFTEDAEILFFGPYLQYFGGMLDIMIKYVIEKRGEEPGIHDGDVFLQNDPWVGTAHQPDVGIFAPVFWEGQIFCWVANCLHQNDVGGTTPGSFCPNAQDIYFDPPVFPPVRIVKEGKLDTEIEAAFRRQSRTPANVALDLRAAIAACHASRARILGLIKKYGPKTVKGVMKKVLNTSEKALLDRLSTIPDGTWRERAYQEVAVTGDRGVYRIELSISKKGNTLTVKNEGTDGQAGAINLPFAAWRGAILSAFNVILLADQMGAGGGGAARHCEFIPTTGTMTCPDYGVAVSPAGIYATELGIAMANSVVTKMLLSSSDPELHKLALSTTNGQWQIQIHAGTNQRGEYYVGPMLDTMIGSSGATPYRDGSFADGQWWIPEGQGPNVEGYERDWPILYLYRKEHQDSAGAGKFRGGNGGILAYMPHKGQVGLGVYTAEGIPKTSGILGGSPGTRGETVLIKSSNIKEILQSGRLIDKVDELTGERPSLTGKGPALALGDSDVLEWNWGSCAGYGDPLLRDPERVRQDVLAGTTSISFAETVYGVIFTEDITVDEISTERRRLQNRKKRLEDAGAPVSAHLEFKLQEFHVPQGMLTLGDNFWFNKKNGATEICCSHCGEVLAAGDQNYKSRVPVRKSDVGKIGLKSVDVKRFVDAQVWYHEYFCPTCATLLSTEVVREGDEPLHEFLLS
ncbi:hydantoinase B/oxoprolinase family protein [Paenibacillus naphthalenovorans]|uniref:hydantoinase B/oxoprolinase family protein n=1 Tax=Paenibacillus naphthalenovorans TaxID=162209 RepID=UPI000882F03E|nr:hydantoinase B/oxoprolinase family protein [Paenibacillus naphthalenovorans]SDI40499.1 N-methylhydantoinase B [Paenibacillus naphthalenovorans]